MDYQLTIDYSIGRWGYSKQYVRSVLASYKGKPIDVKISSLGGDLDHGLDIRQQFIDHGDVTVHIHGFTASSATVIAMGAKRVCMSRYAMFLVHKCSNFIDVWGNLNADEMQKLIENLTENKRENDKIDVVLANMYAARCHKKVSEILEVLKSGRWLTAQEALDYGFIDEIEDPDPNEPAKGNLLSPEMEEKLNAFGLGTEGLNFTLEEKPSLWERVKSSIFGPSMSKAAVENSVDEKSDNTLITSKMKTITLTAALAAVMAVQTVEANDEGKVAISEEILSKIGEKLDALTADISAKDAEITRLKADIEELKKVPATTTDDVTDDASEKKLTASDMYNSVKNLL